jgi:chemotaxis protein MotB
MLEGSGPAPVRRRGGAWKVAYADFVTALMALFIVLWLITAGQDVRQAVSAYFQDPRGHARLTGSAQAGAGQAIPVDSSNVEQLRERLALAMASVLGIEQFSKYVHFTVTGEGLRIELMESEGGMFFESGSPRPSGLGVRLLEMLARELQNLPNSVVIEGHTDARPYRSSALEAYGNWDLSVDRANTARRTLVASGLEPERIAEVRGYADRRPAVPDDPHDSRNRRVSLIIKFADPPEKPLPAPAAAR